MCPGYTPGRAPGRPDCLERGACFGCVPGVGAGAGSCVGAVCGVVLRNPRPLSSAGPGSVGRSISGRVTLRAAVWERERVCCDVCSLLSTSGRCTVSRGVRACASGSRAPVATTSAAAALAANVTVPFICTHAQLCEHVDLTSRVQLGCWA